ncbi:MAG: GNAT family N-acetyltransferase [Phenylobacterium sp.]|nr:GNAT family N-acetyltransferase [Phenylobacterium sp.]
MLRPATSDDASAIAALLRHTLRTSLPFLPDLHTPEEDQAFVAGRVLPLCEVWVAEVGDRPVGFVAWRDDWIDHLYIHPDHQGQGIGPALLAKALAHGPPKQLWTFQANARARRFYEARGFQAAEFTDGEGNEERTPDVRYIWRG